MKTPAAPLQLDTYFIEELHVATNPSYAEGVSTGAGVPDLQIDITAPTRRKDGSRHFAAKLRVRVNARKKDFASGKYKIDITVFGRFSIEPDTLDKVAENLTFYNAPSILYGLARGSIAQETASFPWGRVILPAVNLLEWLKRGARTRSKSAKKSTPKAREGK